MPTFKKRKSLSKELTEKLLWKARQSKFYQYSLNKIYMVASEKGHWDMRRTQDEFELNISLEMMRGKQRFFEQGYSIFNDGYELLLLSDTAESQTAMNNIVSNARSRTMKHYIQEEEGKVGKNQKEIQKEFEKKYNYLSEESKMAIKKGRKSGINRYKKPVIFVELGENQNYLKDNTVDCQADMELEELVMNELNEKEKLLLSDLMEFSDEEIAEKNGVESDSIKRRRRRLRNKIETLLDTST